MISTGDLAPGSSSEGGGVQPNMCPCVPTAGGNMAINMGPNGNCNCNIGTGGYVGSTFRLQKRMNLTKII